MHNTGHRMTRRRLLLTAGSAALAVGVGARIIVPGRASAQQKTLKILQWKHFVPAYDKWFNETYTKEWGEKNHTRVMVENVGIGDIPHRAAEESKAQYGHDLFAHVYPLPAYEDEVIDHRELYEECERKYGTAHDLAIKTTYNPKTQKFWGFADYYYVLPINYRKDLWDAVGTVPDTWEHVRQGGRKIKLLHDKPVGIGLGGDGDGEAAVRALLYSFGASEQDADNRPALQSPAALGAFKFVKALYEEAMTAEVLTWDAASNNRLMLEGAGSLVLNAISIPRTAENTKNPVGEQIWLAPGPQGSVRRLTPVNGIQSYFIWKFAKNIDGAKQFLVDYMGQFRHGFMASELYNVPCFPHTVPDMQALLSHDAKATPARQVQSAGGRRDLDHCGGCGDLQQRAHRQADGPGRHRQADAGGGPHPGRRAGAACFPKVARTRQDIASPMATLHGLCQECLSGRACPYSRLLCVAGVSASARSIVL